MGRSAPARCGSRSLRYSGVPSDRTASAASSAATSSAERLVGSGRLAPLGHLVLHRLEVGQRELELDHPQVLERVGRPGHVVVGEGPQHEHDRVDLADVGQEAVAQALALARPLHQAADVDELDAGGTTLRLFDIAARASSRRSGTLATPTLGSRVAKAYGAASAPPPGQGVVQRRLARVGQPDEPEPFHLGGVRDASRYRARHGAGDRRTRHGRGRALPDLASLRVEVWADHKTQDEA